MKTHPLDLPIAGYTSRPNTGWYFFALFLFIFFSYAACDAFAQANIARPTQYESPDYAQRHTSQGGLSNMNDEFTWAYTKEFGQRFGMPEKWVDANFGGGLLAIAWRMAGYKYDVGVCDAKEHPNNCLSRVECQMDLYLDEKRVTIEWNNPAIGKDVFKQTLKSIDWLREQGHSDTDRGAFVGENIAQGNKAARAFPIGWGIPSPVRYGLSRKFNYLSDLIAYDRVSVKGITFLSFVGNGACPLVADAGSGFAVGYSRADREKISQNADLSLYTPANLLEIPQSFYARIRPLAPRAVGGR